MDKHPKVFISYSHSDKKFADKFAEDLIGSGIDIWIDTWEILPGDSIIDKIYSEGLKNTDTILILLSSSSIKSKWVKEELNIATIKRIEDFTRVIPIILESIDIPLPLRTLNRVNMSVHYDEPLRELIKTIHGVSDKPKIGTVPNYVTSLKPSVGGLSEGASTIGSVLIKDRLIESHEEHGNEKTYSAKDLNNLVSFMTIEEFNDAIEEMEDFGLVKPYKCLGTNPYNFLQLTATYRLLLHFKNDGLEYDPEEDIKIVALAIVSTDKTIVGEVLRETTNLSPLRINHAINYLNDHRLIKLTNFMGSAPYNFGIVNATRQTRQFVRTNCK